MKKLLLIIASVFLLSACNLGVETEIDTPQQVTMTGTFVCLPHKEQGEFQTQECAFGIQTEDGKYYAVDFGLSSNSEIEPAIGEEFTASGILTPIEEISSDHWSIYPIEGIFSVTVRR